MLIKMTLVGFHVPSCLHPSCPLTFFTCSQQTPKSLTFAPMSRKINRLFKRGEIIEVEIMDFAYGGKGIARIPTEHGDFTVFVQNTFPGQRVKARIIKCKSRFAECKLDEVLERAPEEVDQPYQPIPGAPYARVPIELQQKLKEQTTLELFRRIGKVADIENSYEGFISSPSNWHYRNKMEYSFSVIRYDLEEEKEYDDFGLGFKHRGTWWSVENLDKDSGLFDEEFENNLHLLRKFCEESGLPAWHPPKRYGFFRFLAVRKSYASNELLVNLVTSTDNLEAFDLNGFCELLKELFGERLTGFIHSTNDDKGDRVEARAGNSRVVWGKETITENILGLNFDISMSSFFQTNPKSAERLYSKAVDYAIEGNDAQTVYMDLFCGTGTIGQILGRQVESKVVGVDIVESAIENARISAKNNGIENAEFIAADAGKFLYEHPEYTGKIDCIMLDPPRAGIAPKTLRKVIRLGAKRIVYISCNPATQARDTETMHEFGYELKKMSLCDQFPHTSHIESVAVFEKKN